MDQGDIVEAVVDVVASVGEEAVDRRRRRGGSSILVWLVVVIVLAVVAGVALVALA